MKNIYLLLILLLSGCSSPYKINEKISYLEMRSEEVKKKNEELESMIVLQARVFSEQIDILNLKLNILNIEHEKVKKRLAARMVMQ